MCPMQILDTLPISTHLHNALFEKCYVCTCHKLIESGGTILSNRTRYRGAISTRRMKRCRRTLWNSLTAKNRAKMTSPGNSSSRSSRSVLSYRVAKDEVASSDLASYPRMRKCSRLLDCESISAFDLSA